MGQGGWLDQILLGLLNFLNQTWLGIAAALVGGFAVAFLAKRSPGSDWEFVKDGPDRVLTGAFFLLASLKTVPRFVAPHFVYNCQTHTDPILGIPVNDHCQLVTQQSTTAYDYTFGDLVREFGGSLLQSLVWGLVGTLLGLVVGLAVNRLAGPRPA